MANQNKAQAVQQLKAAGCPDDCCDKIADHCSDVGTAGAKGGPFAGITISLLISLATKYGPTLWSILQELLANQPAPAPTPTPAP